MSCENGQIDSRSAKHFNKEVQLGDESGSSRSLIKSLKCHMLGSRFN